MFLFLDSLQFTCWWPFLLFFFCPHLLLAFALWRCCLVVALLCQLLGLHCRKELLALQLNLAFAS